MSFEQFNIPRYLLTLPLFSHLEQTELEQITAGCTLRRLERGKLLFRQGEPCDGFYIVVTGQIKLFVLSHQGSEKIIELCGPGRSFAEALVFTGMSYVVSAQALSESLLIKIDKKVVLEEFDHNPNFARHMLAGLSRRLHGLIKDVESYALHSGVERVIGYLLGECITDAEKITAPSITVSLPVSKGAIASRLSLTPEYFSRVLHELESAGLIQVNRRDIHIRDTVRLANYQAR